MQPRTLAEREKIFASNPHLLAEEIDQDLDEYDRLLAERNAVNPTKPDPGEQVREACIKELAEKLFHD